jgi:hypothetical protein
MPLLYRGLAGVKVFYNLGLLSTAAAQSLPLLADRRSPFFAFGDALLDELGKEAIYSRLIQER